MQRELIAVPEHWTVGQIIDYLRENPELTTDFWEVFVVDPGHRPVGALKLSWVLRTPRWAPVADALQREQTLIPVELDRTRGVVGTRGTVRVDSGGCGILKNK